VCIPLKHAPSCGTYTTAAGNTSAFDLTVQVFKSEDNATSNRSEVADYTLRLPRSPADGVVNAVELYSARFAYAWHPYTVACGETVTGDRLGAVNVAGFNGTDHLYAFSPTVPAIVTLSLCNSTTVDTAMAVWSAGSGAFGLGTIVGSCDDSTCTGSLLSSTGCLNDQLKEVVTTTLRARDYVIQVEASDFDGGINGFAYELHVACAPIPTATPTASPSTPPTALPTTAPTPTPTELLPAPTRIPTTRIPTTLPTSLPSTAPSAPPVLPPTRVTPNPTSSPAASLNPSSPSSSGGASTEPTLTIAGVVAGLSLLIIVVVAAVCVCSRSRSKRPPIPHPSTYTHTHDC
jgi:hypothetical protein